MPKSRNNRKNRKRKIQLRKERANAKENQRRKNHAAMIKAGVPLMLMHDKFKKGSD